MYLGTLGRMVEVKCPTQQQVSSAERYSFMTTLGGAVKAQAGPVGRRTWNISTGRLTTPADVGVLMDFADGAWGAGPFRFVSADAPVVNMLTPGAASCDPTRLVLSEGAELLGSPPMSLDGDGYAARSVWTNGVGAVTFECSVPVVNNTPVTGAAWVTGEGRLQLVFLNASGTVLSRVNSILSQTSGPQRLAVSTIAPWNAAAVQLAVIGNITQTARPTVTWTDQPYEWGDGQGCNKAVVHNVARDVVKAWDNPTTGRWSDMSFTIQEVG